MLLFFKQIRLGTLHCNQQETYLAPDLKFVKKLCKQDATSDDPFLAVVSSHKYK